MRLRALVPAFVALATVTLLAVACGDDDSGGGQPSQTPVISRNGAAKVGFGGGTVSLEGGPEVQIPTGAIAGGAQDASVTISKSAQQMSLPAGLMKAVGQVYDIGPEGATFDQPVLVTLPIPAGTDPGDVLGLATVDPDSGKWAGVSSTVDTKARTVSAFTTHFSPWGMVGGRSEAAKTGGWIKIVNAHARGSDSFPGAKHLPMALENLVCFTAYAPTSPGSLIRPTFNTVIARDQTTIEYWLPAGSYTLEEGKFASEINNDPLYSPAFKWWTRPAQTIVLTPGITVNFGEPNSIPPGGNYAEVPNRCAGGSGVPTPTGTPKGTSSQTEEEFFKVSSLGGVSNGATQPTTFTINSSWLVTSITTYHWNDAQGTTTTGTIGLRAAGGATFGPWQTTGQPGQGGVPNAYWVAAPNVVIPPGTYTVVDSDPSTWAQNDETGGAGIAWGSGIRQ